MSELNGVGYNNVIPAGASLEEGAFYVVEAAESDFAKLMKSIGIQELGVLESTGTEMLYEAGKLKGLVDNIVEWFKNRFADIMGLFNKALNMIKTKTAEFNGKMKGFALKGLTAKADKLVADKEFGKTYEYAKLDEVLEGAGKIWTAINGLEADITGLKESYNGSDVEGFTEKVKAAKEKCQKELGVKEAGIKDAVVEYIRGAEVTINKDYVTKNIEGIVAGATDFTKSSSKINKQIKVIKKSFDNTIKDIKKGKKEADEGMYKAYFTGLKDSKNMVTTIAGATLSCVKEKLNTDRKIVMKLAVAGKAKEEKEDVKETKVKQEAVTYQQEAASLFNWPI